MILVEIFDVSGSFHSVPILYNWLCYERASLLPTNSILVRIKEVTNIMLSGPSESGVLTAEPFQEYELRYDL